MFDFISTQENGKTIARLDEYTAHFTSSGRNTRITAVVIADEDTGECRATGSLFYHYDAAAQGHSHCDTGARQYDNNVLV